jgi:hypothetical protein
VTHQEGEYVLEKQVNGQGVSPYDPSHNSTAVLVGKPNLFHFEEFFVNSKLLKSKHVIEIIK